jgi:hypothetical protein
MHVSEAHFLTVFLGCSFQVQDTYYLVSLVDNNYIDGDLFAVFNLI